MPFFKIQIPEKGNRFPPVTPLSQRYNNVWMNGGAVPSSEADSRAFSFDIIPSSQIDNLTIVKNAKDGKFKLQNVYFAGMDAVGADGYTPIAGSPLLGAASFAGWTGFDTVSYIGAFDGSNNWMSGWTNFDPQNAKY